MDRDDHDAAQGACGPPLPAPNTGIQHVEEAIFANTVEIHHHHHAPQSEEDPDNRGNLSKNDWLVLLLEEILNQGDGKPQPMYQLEQAMCARLRKATKKPVPTFKDYYGNLFRYLLEGNPSRFTITTVDKYFLVGIKKSKKKKKKKSGEQKSSDSRSPAGEDQQHVEETTTLKTCFYSPEDVSPQPADEEGWESQPTKKKSPIKSKAAEKSLAKGRSSTESPPHAASESPLRARSPTQTKKREEEMDAALMKNLLSQHPGDSLLLHRYVHLYKHDRVQFTLDVVSMWNVPNRGISYIVLGVKQKQKLPHVVTGLQSPLSEEFIKGLFHWQIFAQLPPQFSYREVTYDKKLVGIIRIESNFGKGFPCVVTSDDLAPRIQKNQLWVRKGDQNRAIEPSDLSVGCIHAWFQAIEVKEVKVNTANSSMGTKTEDTGCSDTGTSPTATTELQEGPVCQSAGSQATSSDSSRIMKELHDFKKGHFVLLCGSLKTTQCRTTEALAQAPWIAVYDFDFNGRDSGLLAFLEDSLKKRRSVSVLTWCDPYTGLTELGTQWWSMRGRREVPDSKTSDLSHQEWYTKVLDKVDKLCLELARFSEDYTVLTFFVLWPCSDMEARCMHKFLTKARERVHPKLILCSTDKDVQLANSRVAQMIQYEYEDAALVFHTTLEELCHEIELKLQDSKTMAQVLYNLPGEETKTVLSDKDAAWLAEDFDVLFYKNTYAKQKLTADDLKAEAENFCRGGTIRWYTWYDVGPGYLDVERSISRKMTEHIKSHFITNYKSGTVTLYHAPGSGGTTMAQRVLWDLHEVVPCAKVRQRSGSSPEEVADKLVFLYQRTRLPVVALFDGEDEPRLKQVQMHLQRSPVIVLSVKRYPYRLMESKQTEHNFFLAGFVIPQESRNLVLRYSDRCDQDEGKVKKLKQLDTDVQEDKEHHQMFEYGMTVYAHEFQGVRAYVRGYLGLPSDASKPLEPWQKCLGYIALVFFYGQTSVPCQFFVKLMGHPQNYVMSLDDFPEQFQILVVQDSNEGRHGYLRIAHYIIAGEILEQILNRRFEDTKARRRSGLPGREGRSRGLSTVAKRNLKYFCIEFINDVAKKRYRSVASTSLTTYILMKTFIFRENEEVSDDTTQDTLTRRKPMFSQIMNDLDWSPPYIERLEVMKRMCDTFPQDPNFRAHLGRFYSICRPEEEEEAEKHFKHALKLCDSLRGDKGVEELDDRSKQTLVHVHHMFGNAYQRRIAKYTGWNPGDEASVTVNKEDMMETLEEVINNAKTACDNFTLARMYTPSGQESSFTFTNEIHVRLQACEFVNRVYRGQLPAFLSRKPIDHKVEFIRDSIPIIEDLIMECYNVIMSFTFLQKNVRWFYSLFHQCTEVLKKLIEGEDLTSLRLSLSRKKLKFRGPDSIVAVENVDVPEREIESIVSTLEMIFCYQQTSHDMTKRMLDLYYKDWILAIRNPRFTKVYSLEDVLKHVRQWHEAVHSPQSTFYLFVLRSLLGFGTSKRPGMTDCLVEADMMLQDDAMLKLAKTVIRPRCPREWLGRDDAEGIRRLIASSSVGHVEERCVKNPTSSAKLAVCKGTIRTRNKKLGGYIDLDLGDNSTAIKVFYIPLLSELVGSRYEGERVQFHLAFTLEKGYEAYDVRLLERKPCSNCGLRVEMTWDQQEIVCKCGSVIVNYSHLQTPSVHSRTASFESST